MSQNPDSQFRDLHRVLLNYISDAVFVYQRVADDKASNFIDVNDAACKMLGYTKDELLKMSHNDLSDDLHQDAIKYSDEKHMLFESTLRSKDGRNIPVEISSHIFMHNGISTVIATARDITERKKTEDDQRENEERYRALFHNINEAVYMSHRSSTESARKFIDVNDVACKMMGYSKEEFLNMGPMDIADPDYAIDYNELGKRLFADKHVLFESNHIAKDGRKIPVEINAHLFDYKGKPTAVSIIRDITERKKQEEDRERTQEELERRVVDRTAELEQANAQLKQEVAERQKIEEQMSISNQEWRSTFDSVGDAICLMDNQGIVLRCNSATARLLGKPYEEIIGRQCWQVFHCTPEPINQCPRMRMQASHKKEVEVLAIDDRWIEITAFPQFDSDGKLSGTVHIMSDITGRKNAQDEILRLTSAMEQASDGFAIADNDGIIIYTNAAHAKMHGYTQKELIGSHLGTLNKGVITPEYRDIAIADILNKRNVPSIEVEHAKKDGTAFPAMVSLAYLTNDEGENTGIVTVVRDITERKRAEEKLRESDERVTDLISTMHNAVFVYRAVDNGDDFAFTEFNHAAEEMEGKLRDEIIGKHVAQISPAATEVGLLAALRRVYKTGKSEHYPPSIYEGRKGGLDTWREVWLYRLSSGEVVAEYSDVTELKRTEKALRESDERVTDLISTMHNAVLVYSAVDTGDDFVFTEFNRAAEVLDERSKEDVIGKRVSEVSHVKAKESGLIQALKRVYKTGNPEHYDPSLYPDRAGGPDQWRECWLYKLSSGEVVAEYNDVTENKKAEAEIRKLSSAMQQAHDGIAIFNRDTGYISYTNSSYEQMLGYGPQELLNMHIRHLMNRTTSGKYPSLADVLDDKRPAKQNVDVEHIRKDGSVFPAVMSLSYVFDDKGDQTDDILIVTRDMTENKRTESEILRLNAAMEQASDGIAIFTQSSGAISYANNAFAESLGYTQQNIIGVHIRHTLDKVISNEFATLGALLDLYETTARTLEVAHLRKDGSVFPALLSIAYLMNEAGEPTDNVVVVSSDITQLKQAEEAVKESEERYRASFDKARDAINVFTPNRTFVDANSKLLELCGYSKEELLKLHLFDIYPEAATEESKQRVIDAAQGKEVAVFVTNLVRKDGKTIPVEIAFTALRNTYGQDLVFQSNIRDITERKQMEARIRQTNEELEKANVELQEADKLKSIFLASMSHELRTPLNSIIGFTSLILQGLTGQINKEQHSQLSIVKSSATHLLSLINDVLDLSKLEAGRVDLMLDKFKLDDMLRESLGTFAPMVEMKGIQLNSDYPENITLNNDVRRMKQIVINLVSNAVKFTDSGSVELTASVTNSTLLIKVKDTGLGMREEDIRRLFQPFQQINEQLVKNREGTGLGLYLSRKLANLMGGEIAANSEYGKGSVFTFTSPLDIEKAKGSGND